MDFRTRLRDQIEYLGLLNKEVANLAGISKRTMDSYVGSQSCMPSADVAVRLAKVLGVSVEYLVTGESPVYKNEHANQDCLYDKDALKLVRNFSELSEHDKNTILALSQILISSKEKS